MAVPHEQLDAVLGSLQRLRAPRLHADVERPVLPVEVEEHRNWDNRGIVVARAEDAPLPFEDTDNPKTTITDSDFLLQRVNVRKEDLCDVRANHRDLRTLQDLRLAETAPAQHRQGVGLEKMERATADLHVGSRLPGRG